MYNIKCKKIRIFIVFSFYRFESNFIKLVLEFKIKKIINNPVSNYDSNIGLFPLIPIKLSLFQLCESKICCSQSLLFCIAPTINSCCSFTILKAIAKSKGKFFAKAFKLNKEQQQSPSQYLEEKLL